MRYWVVVNQDHDGKFIAECPTIPGCIAKADTKDEALRAIKKAIETFKSRSKLVN